jgi:hypothetical protein
MTLERFAVHYPDLGSDALADELRKWQEQTKHLKQTIPLTLPGITTYEELVALDPAEFLERSLTTNDPRASLVQLLRRRERTVPDELIGVPKGLEYVVIGSVYETEELVHVLYRHVYHRADEEPNRGPVEYESLQRQSDGSWRLLIQGRPFLQPQGSSVTILDEEFADLWDAESA